MKLLGLTLASALFALSAQAQSSQWFVDATTGIAHHKPSRGFCPAFLGGLPRTDQIEAKRRGEAAVCTYGPPSQPDAQRISIQEVPNAPRAQIDDSFRASLLDRFPGSSFAPTTEAICQQALTEKMGTPEALCMVFQRDGFTAFVGFHVINGWSFQPMLVTSGQGLAEENIRMIGTTFGEIYTVEAQFMQLPSR